MLGRRTGAFKIDGRESLVDLAVQAQGAAGHGHALGFHLRLVAHGLVGGNGVEHAGLRAGQGELLDGRVVEAQRVSGVRGPSTASSAASAASCAARRAPTQAASASADAAPPASQA